MGGRLKSGYQWGGGGKEKELANKQSKQPPSPKIDLLLLG